MLQNIFETKRKRIVKCLEVNGRHIFNLIYKKNTNLLFSVVIVVYLTSSCVNWVFWREWASETSVLKANKCQKSPIDTRTS
jgi:hypothetical protein